MTDELKWRRIAETIADDIRSGRRPIGSKLPRHDDPREITRHDADPNTIREARIYLRDIGVLSTSPRGTYVAQMPPAVLPPRVKVSPLERRVNARIDELTRRLDEHERRRHDG